MRAPGTRPGPPDIHERQHYGAKANWHRTGDAGRLDGRGCLWLPGRCSARVELPRLGVVYPFEIEWRVRAHTGVRCALLPTPPAGATLFAETAHHADVLDDIRRLVDPAIEVRPIGRLPMDRWHNAKIDYDTLRRLAMRR